MADASVADSLRALADWYDAHPDAPGPCTAISVGGEDTPEDVARWARALSPCDKETADTVFKLGRTFGTLRFEVLFWRQTVCTRRVVGTREVPAHVEEIIEWDCPESLLGKTGAPSARSAG